MPVQHLIFFIRIRSGSDVLWSAAYHPSSCPARLVSRACSSFFLNLTIFSTPLVQLRALSASRPCYYQASFIFVSPSLSLFLCLSLSLALCQLLVA